MSKRLYTEYAADSSVTTAYYTDSESEEERGVEEVRHQTIHWGPTGGAHRDTTFSQVPASPKKKTGPRERAFDVLGPDLPPIEEGVEPEEETIHDGYAFDDGHPAATAPRAVRDSVSFIFTPAETYLEINFPQDFPMQQWQDNHQETFVKEVVRLSGRGGYRRQQACDECATPDVPAIHRCKDCFTDALFCSGCIVALHVDNPFHWIEVSSASKFVLCRTPT
jgi:hypothetical protein